MDFAGAKDQIENQLPQLQSAYQTKHIYNTDESTLHNKALPNATLVADEEIALEIKMSKSQFTVLLICNKDGSDKCLLLGNQPLLGAFVTKRILQSCIFSNKKAWMTGETLKVILLQLENNTKVQKQSVIVFCDTASCYLIPTQLPIYVVFLPPNLTLQP